MTKVLKVEMVGGVRHVTLDGKPISSVDNVSVDVIGKGGNIRCRLGASGTDLSFAVDEGEIELKIPDNIANCLC